MILIFSPNLYCCCQWSAWCQGKQCSRRCGSNSTTSKKFWILTGPSHSNWMLVYIIFHFLSLLSHFQKGHPSVAFFKIKLSSTNIFFMVLVCLGFFFFFFVNWEHVILGFANILAWLMKHEMSVIRFYAETSV